MKAVGSGRVRSFDEIDDAAGGAGTVNRMEKHYLNVDDEDIVGAVKRYAKKALKIQLTRYYKPEGAFDRFKNQVGYTKALIAKYGILVLAARRRMDKENPKSLISKLEKRLEKYVTDVIKKLKLPENVYTPWMRILSYPSSKIGGCHPWILRFKETLGESVIESAEQIRALNDMQRRIIIRKISKSLGPKRKEFKQTINRLQRIHFWSEKDEWEEDEDLDLTNNVVDVFCTHVNSHKTMKDIAGCPTVKSYLDPGKLRKLMLLAYVLLDDFIGPGRDLRKTKKAK
jgi:hypothetical protein